MELGKRIDEHFNNFFEIAKNAEFTVNEQKIDNAEWFGNVIKSLNKIRQEGKSLYFIGNGASASISSHFATDFTKNGEIPSSSIAESSLLTCFSNDYSYEDAYMEILKKIMKDGDGLVAISSSGSSKNILNAAKFVKNNLINSPIITFSSFSPDNSLKKLGNYNLYLMSYEYSFAESGHAYYLHLLTDLFCNQKIETFSKSISAMLNSVNEIKNIG